MRSFKAKGFAKQGKRNSVRTIRPRRSVGVLLGATIAAASIVGVAGADDISNDLDASIDAVAEAMPLNVGGANGTTQLYVTPRNGDGKNGCNFQSSTALGLSVSSSNTAVATVSPSSVTFQSCSDMKTLTVTPHNQGSATISVSQTSNNTAATFNLAPARFTVDVAPPPNTPPTVTVAGVTGGAPYDKGSVPNATCQVTDAEDGNSSFAATLSAVTGPYAADGIGSQTASCSYTDGGGLTASGSETYSIVDPSGPTIGYTVSPTGPDGENGWYKSDVTLTWTVTEPESPNSLQQTDCVDQSITTDQGPTTYSCSATSAGGSSGPETVTIKRDATEPSVTCGSADGVWHAADASLGCTASDAGSGLADSGDAGFSLSTDVAAGTETDNASTGSHDVYDAAGNKSTAGPISGNKVDRKAPGLTDSGPTTNPNPAGWHKTAVTNTFAASDGGSGLKSPCAATFSKTSGSQEGTGLKIASGACEDNVGNSTPGVDSAAFSIDLTAPGVTWHGAIGSGDSFYFGSVPTAPTCEASDSLSGPKDCTVSGYSNHVGSHELTAAAHDVAGNETVEKRSYSVLAWTLKGFHQPVDMNGVLNSVKNGSTVPLKFELFAGATELTSTADVKSLTATQITCDSSNPIDDIEVTATGGTSLRYDASGGQFIYNWQTPKKPGTCYRVTMTTQDGSTLVALFKLK